MWVQAFASNSPSECIGCGTANYTLKACQGSHMLPFLVGTYVGYIYVRGAAE
jgi:hypothetical protein